MPPTMRSGLPVPASFWLGSVFDGVGHGADPGKRGHRGGGDGLHPVGGGVVALRGPVALVPGIEQATEAFVAVSFGPEDGGGMKR